MPDSLNKFARHWWTPLVAVALLVFLCGMGWRAHSEASRHDRTRAQLDLDVISDSLASLTKDGSKAISPSVATHLDARLLYGILSATNGGVYFLGHQPEWDCHRELVDPWGHPYQVQFISPKYAANGSGLKTAAKVRIWSVGPNGRDEQGTGDDVTCPLVAIRLRQ